jgi:hypothetical protein
MQACYVGAMGARAMHALQGYGQAEPTYDNKAYTFSSTYHDGPFRLLDHFVAQEIPDYGDALSTIFERLHQRCLSRSNRRRERSDKTRPVGSDWGRRRERCRTRMFQQQASYAGGRRQNICLE